MTGPAVPIYDVQTADGRVLAQTFASTCPECEAGKHGNCDSTSWDFEHDEPCVCLCWHDNGGEYGGPCFDDPGK